jgi:formimidoylglutamate deiminase
MFPDFSYHVTRLFAPVALLPNGWAFDVLLEIGEDGCFSTVTPASSSNGLALLSGAVVPGMPNVHSHAFQRVLAGRTERSSAGKPDSFWTWREAMYKLAERIDPEQLEAIATFAYIEMLKAGYTSVAEFHYLHNRPDGKPYERPTELAERVIHAAKTAGIGLTLLPTLYIYSDFAGSAPKQRQKRFVLRMDAYAALWDDLVSMVAQDPQVRLGAAAHSLRAVGRAELTALVAVVSARDKSAPLHIHVSEQRVEVDACRVAYGMSPIDYLADVTDINQRWCLIHATHATPDELAKIASCGAVIGLSPTTEGNLGDGIFPAVSYVERCGLFAIGSDSNVSIDVAEELRWLEYTQRLGKQKRVLLVSKKIPSVGDFLYRNALLGGARALGQKVGALEPGARADFVVLENFTTLDQYIFSAGRFAVRDVMVAGIWVVREHTHPAEEQARLSYRRAVDALS